MMSGVITKNPSFCLDVKPLQLSPRQSSTSLSFWNNTYLPKSPSLSPNGAFSPKSCGFRTKATINDEVVVSETEAMNLSFYELLGISESGSFGEIKQAYKQLARKYHPDVSPPERTEEYTKRFIRVQEAYETLSDPSRRALYDRDMARGLHLAFSARKYEGLMERDEWRNQWQGQVVELRKKGMNKNSDNNMSWAAQMRRKRFESEME